jgi:hypothetical protein
MRYLDSGTLQERMKAGRLGLEQIDILFTQLANALGYAHSRQVIHRDIKPSNVLITPSGDIFLTDFGLAKLVDDSVQLSLTGTITGTPWYMSPEQALGKELDIRSDIYSLGVVLYEMLTGRVPFNAETPLAVILAHLHSTLPLPSIIEPRIDPAIERVLLKALAKDAAERFANTNEFIFAWKQALQAAVANGMTLECEPVEGVPSLQVSAQPFFTTPSPVAARPATAVIDTLIPIPTALPLPATAELPRRQIHQGRWHVSPWLVGILGSLVGAVLLLGLAFVVSRLFFPPVSQQNLPQINAPQPGAAQQGASQQGLQQLTPQINAIKQQAIASVLGISVEELNAAEAEGKVAIDLASAAGIDQAEFQRLVTEKFSALLKDAVAAGTITQQEADQALSQDLFRGKPAPE